MAKHKWNSKMPAPDDLKGWKETDSWLSQRFAEHLQFEDRLWSSRAAKRYFDDDNLEYFFKEHQERAVVQAYTAWGILDYRPNKTSKTHAEKMLEEGLPEPEATLLRARMEAYPTLYRVAGHNPKAGTIDLEDVLLGGMVTVHDLLMSENIEKALSCTPLYIPASLVLMTTWKHCGPVASVIIVFPMPAPCSVICFSRPFAEITTAGRFSCDVVQTALQAGTTTISPSMAASIAF